MKSAVAKLFCRRDPRREALLALARLATLSDMSSLPWESGICEERRQRNEVNAALGVWLVPLAGDEEIEQVSLANPQQGLCCDLRGEGLGVMTPAPADEPQYLVAIPSGTSPEDGWKFFQTIRCHSTPRPGGWFLTGLHVENVIEPSSDQLVAFRQHLPPYRTAADSA